VIDDGNTFQVSTKDSKEVQNFLQASRKKLERYPLSRKVPWWRTKEKNTSILKKL